MRISVDTSFSPSIRNSWIRMRHPAYIRGVIAPSTFSTAVRRQNHGERCRNTTWKPSLSEFSSAVMFCSFSSAVMFRSFSSAVTAYWNMSEKTRFIRSCQAGLPIIRRSRYTISSANTSEQKAAVCPSGRMCILHVDMNTFWCVVSSSSMNASLLGRRKHGDAWLIVL